MAKTKTARVNRKVSRRVGQVTCLTSRKALTKYLGISQDKTIRTGLSRRQMNEKDLPIKSGSGMRLFRLTVTVVDWSVTSLADGALRRLACRVLSSLTDSPLAA